MNLSPEKVFALRSQIIKAVALLLGILAAANALVYNIFGELYSIRKFKESTFVACGQLGVSYETTISSLAELVNRIGLFDSTDFSAEAEPGKTYEFLTSVDRKLSSIVTANRHILSAYIYLAEPGRVFDSRRVPAMVNSLENFPDREIFPASYSGSVHRIGPRVLDGTVPDQKSYTVITLISPLVTRNAGKAYLAVNVNIDSLYADLSKNIKLDSSFTFYAYNADDGLILHSTDKSRLYSSLDPDSLPEEKGAFFYYLHRNQPLSASYRSFYLDWTFVLEAPVNPAIHDLQSYIAVNLVIVLLMLGLISLVVFVKTAPVSKVAAAVSEVFWKEALLDRVYIDNELIQQLRCRDFAIDTGAGRGSALYGVIGLNSTGENGHEVLALMKEVCEKTCPGLAGKNYAFKFVPLSKNAAALVLKYRAADVSVELHRNTAQKLWEAFPPEEQKNVSISLSGLQKNFALLPLCYRQCEDALKYKKCLESHILDHSLIRDFDREYDFPLELARQMNNNIVAGSKSGCAAYLDKIFIPIEKKRFIVTDEKIVNLVISLQNGVFKTISDLPVPIKVDSESAINVESLDSLSLAGMKASLLSFCEKICDEINTLKENQEQYLSVTVMEHIEKNCLTKHLMSLGSVAEDLGISKNQVSGIVKKTTGVEFPEFINRKRVEYAKELLLDKNMTIEEIAKAAGYNYSYYFIKIFKSLEGVTPGQFRAARIIPHPRKGALPRLMLPPPARVRIDAERIRRRSGNKDPPFPQGAPLRIKHHPHFYQLPPPGTEGYQIPPPLYLFQSIFHPAPFVQLELKHVYRLPRLHHRVCPPGSAS
jgi:AraC-like DNA-binding protein